MGNFPNGRDIANRSTEGVDEQFYNDRLSRSDLSVENYPARIDQAAIDLLYGISIGVSSSQNTGGFAPGGTVAKFDFGRATGEFYRDGLTELSGPRSDLPRMVADYDTDDIGDLAFRLNELRYKLQQLERKSDGETILDINRVIEAVTEKAITQSIRKAESDDAVVRQPLENPETVVEMMLQVFSDPASANYADQLLDVVNGRVGGENLLGVLDAPEMVTPLWQHQREAIEAWLDAGSKGYVDMATATGKTVLGLATIAARYGKLHPVDETEIDTEITHSEAGDPRVLIVAGQDLLLEQWRSEFDEHLNIPRDRTGTGDSNSITLDWGTIEFTTAQELLATEVIQGYDLVILDEAHRYSRGTQSGKGWRTVLEDLVSRSSAVLAMSGSVDQGWIGDETVQNALAENLTRCQQFSVPEARKQGVIADFSWEILYAGARSDDTQGKLAETTDALQRAYDDSNHKFDITELDTTLSDAFDEPFETLTDLRSFSQSKEGTRVREKSQPFDTIATAAFSRRPQRWQLSPSPTMVADLVTRHAPAQKVVVLVQSYSQAAEVGTAIREQIGDAPVLVPDADSGVQFDTIEEFKTGGYDVIVGPGEVIGTGVDMPEADIAINIGKGGVNASLIQRIGRVLRNPSGEKHAKFYQVVTIPSDDTARLDGEDGRRLLRRASEFRALGERLRELPGYTTPDTGTADTLAALETAGAAAVRADQRSLDEIVSDELAQPNLERLLTAVDERTSDATLPSLWKSETLVRETERNDDADAGETDAAEPSEASLQTEDGKQGSAAGRDSIPGGAMDTSKAESTPPEAVETTDGGDPARQQESNADSNETEDDRGLLGTISSTIRSLL